MIPILLILKIVMGYNFEVVYRKGTLNVVADTLSRKPGGEL